MFAPPGLAAIAISQEQYITAAAEYLPYATVPDYKELITVVERVTGITKRIKEKPVRLYK